MGMLAPSRGRHGQPAPKSYADQKRWISNEFYRALNEYTELDDGSQVTKIQAAVKSVVDSMSDPETDPYYRLAALKFVTEHLEGKAAAMKEEQHEEMTKIAIVIGDADAKRITEAVNKMNPAMEHEEVPVGVVVSDEDGSNGEELLV